MAPYRGPENIIISPFLRTEERLFVATRHRSHPLLAKEDRIEDEVERLKLEKPSEVDGGTVMVFGREITIQGGSIGFGLPITEEARDKTVFHFQAQSSGYKVSKG